MSHPPRPAIEFRDAAFSYGGPPALSGVTAAVAPGEALALIGPNGSGKTTLLRGILRAVDVAEGELRVLGVAPGKVRRGAIGYVPQVTDLDPTFPVSVRQVVEMGLYGELGWWRRIGGGQRRRIDAALERVDMKSREGMRFGDLSGGQQQRVLLARSIVARPELILLDEPFNGLDEPNRRALLELIRQLKREGVAVLVSTHDLSLAHETCEKVLLLAGRQVAFGPREEVLTADVIALAYGPRGGALLAPGDRPAGAAATGGDDVD